MRSELREEKIDRRAAAKRATARFLPIAGVEASRNLAEGEIGLQVRRNDAPEIENAKAVLFEI